MTKPETCAPSVPDVVREIVGLHRQWNARRESWSDTLKAGEAMYKHLDRMAAALAAQAKTIEGLKAALQRLAVGRCYYQGDLGHIGTTCHLCLAESPSSFYMEHKPDCLLFKGESK